MDNIVEEKSFKFAVRIVRLYKYLIEKKKENILSKQLLRSGTSIGANVSEAQQAQSNADFISKNEYCLERKHRNQVLDKDSLRDRIFKGRGK